MEYSENKKITELFQEDSEDHITLADLPTSIAHDDYDDDEDYDDEY